ncbi:carbohydrate binding domain-containing protein [Longispora fulva]|nr:carbohydrate binding domain-containing protein [Longispora fulva]
MRRRVRALAIVGAALVAATAVLAAHPASAAGNALANPGFESGLSGWSCPATATADTSGPHSGAAALRGDVTGADTAQCTQTVSVTPSTTYTLSAWVTGAYVYLGVSGGDSVWTPGTGGAYQQLSVTFTTGANASTATVFVHGWYGQGAYRADDFSLPGPGGNPSPSPSQTAGPSPTPSPTGGGGPGAALPACQHFSNDVPPDRPAGPSHDAVSQGPVVDLSGRLPAPGNVRGSLSGGVVTLGFDRVAGAKAYRVWRNAQSVQWVDDWGQASLTVTDKSPCRNAHYTVVALRTDASDASTGQLSRPYRLEDGGTVEPFALAVGSTFTYKITSYNDTGQTASGYTAGLGICAVDTRYIPWGTRLKVAGYGHCYAGDIGTWIQGTIVDVWLPGAEADNWGVQSRTITVE